MHAGFHLPTITDNLVLCIGMYKAHSENAVQHRITTSAQINILLALKDSLRR